MTQAPATKAPPIHIKGARMHNLRNAEVQLPRNRLTVVTGVSGSGKSSLVFDTLYAEGHRRYVESLSSYARQFLARLPKPDVDFIHGCAPAIAIEQRVISSNPRSTVGSITEVYDYLRLLFARLGRTFSPVSGREVSCDNVTTVIDYIFEREAGTRVLLLCPLHQTPGRTLLKELEITLQKGFARLWLDQQVIEIEDLLGFPEGIDRLKAADLRLLIDRFVLEPDDEEFRHRVADSVQTALLEGNGQCFVKVGEGPLVPFSDRFEADGLTFEKPTESLFNFNNPYGACPRCEGFGRVMGLDEDLIVPDRTLSFANGAVHPWAGLQGREWVSGFLKLYPHFPADSPYYRLTDAQREELWFSPGGIHAFFDDLQRHAYKVQNRILISRYRGYSTCPDCRGSRLRREATYVRVGGHTIDRLLALPIDELARTFADLQLEDDRRPVAELIVREINSRLRYLLDVGLGYLSLDRKASTLSGGETQRINLATSLGSSLVGSMYILDEPTIGLHPRDTDRLIDVLLRLRDLGNTVVVVEHDETVMRRADWLIDMGPLAGELGGQVVAAGPVAEVAAHPESLTGRYLAGKLGLRPPAQPRSPKGWVRIVEAAEHNLKGINVDFPLGCLVGVAGVSGSGKTTLVKQILYLALREHLGLTLPERPGLHRALSLEGTKPSSVELIDQGALSVTSRSNPATYTGAYDAIRQLFADTPAAEVRRLPIGAFSYNAPGGRCETCEGEGFITVPMQFLPDVKLPCETCNGRRFKQVVLEVEYNGKNIHEVLEMTVTEAVDFFQKEKKIIKRLDPLLDVGLGYLRLGQSTNTLSGGEAQRLKLAFHLQVRDGKPMFFVFDEPTTGLHAHDVHRLALVFDRLVDLGHTVVVIEHNIDLLLHCDWLLELGPEGGVGGGELVFAGRPLELAQTGTTFTAPYLKEALARSAAGAA